MQVTNTEWFSGPRGVIGVVQVDAVDETTGNLKNYIGPAKGDDEAADAADIAANGAKFRVPPWMHYEAIEKAVAHTIKDFYAEVCRRADDKRAAYGEFDGLYFMALQDTMKQMGLMDDKSS